MLLDKLNQDMKEETVEKYNELKKRKEELQRHQKFIYNTIDGMATLMLKKATPYADDPHPHDLYEEFLPLALKDIGTLYLAKLTNEIQGLQNQMDRL